MTDQITELQKLLSPAKVAEIVGVSRNTLWRWEKENPEFPKPMKISTGRVAYREREIRQWLDDLSTMGDAA